MLNIENPETGKLTNAHKRGKNKKSDLLRSHKITNKTFLNGLDTPMRKVLMVLQLR